MNKNNLKDPREDAFNYHLRGNSFFFLNGMNFYKEFFFENINASRVYLWPAGGLIFYLWKKHHLFYQNCLAYLFGPSMEHLCLSWPMTVCSG